MAEIVYRLAEKGPKHSCQKEIGWDDSNEVHQSDYPADVVILCSCGNRYFTSRISSSWSRVHRLTIFNKMYWNVRKQVQA